MRERHHLRRKNVGGRKLQLPRAILLDMADPYGAVGRRESDGRSALRKRFARLAGKTRRRMGVENAHRATEQGSDRAGVAIGGAYDPLHVFALIAGKVERAMRATA